MAEKTWTDQPDDVVGAEVKLRINLSGGGVAEVRACAEPDVSDETERWTHRRFFVTAGTLFGSQTVEAMGTDAMLAALSAVAEKRRKGGVPLPPGCRLLSQ